MSQNTSTIPMQWNNWQYITSIDVNSRTISHNKPEFGYEQTITVESDVGPCFIETEVPCKYDKDDLINAYKEIIALLDGRDVFDINVDDDISFHSPRGRNVDSYYYTTGKDDGIREVSFNGEGVTEEEIRRQTENMIEKMKEDDLL